MQKEPKVLIQTFSDDEVRSLLSAFDYSTYLSARNKMILAIAFDTGARNTEICQIKREDIHDNVILIHGKGNKERHVPISPYLQKVMLKYERIHFSFGSIRKQGATIGSLFDYLQAKKLLFLCFKFLLGDNAAVQQFLELLKFVSTTLAYHLLDGSLDRNRWLALTLNQ